jgi:hypothetical protein
MDVIKGIQLASFILSMYLISRACGAFYRHALLDESWMIAFIAFCLPMLVVCRRSMISCVDVYNSIAVGIPISLIILNFEKNYAYVIIMTVMSICLVLSVITKTKLHHYVPNISIIDKMIPNDYTRRNIMICYMLATAYMYLPYAFAYILNVHTTVYAYIWLATWLNFILTLLIIRRLLHYTNPRILYPLPLQFFFSITQIARRILTTNNTCSFKILLVKFFVFGIILCNPSICYATSDIVNYNFSEP